MTDSARFRHWSVLQSTIHSWLLFEVTQDLFVTMFAQRLWDYSIAFVRMGVATRRCGNNCAAVKHGDGIVLVSEAVHAHTVR